MQNRTRCKRALTIVALFWCLGGLAWAAPPAIRENPLYVVRADHWSDADERDYERFITAIGESDCGSLNACLHSPANMFFGSDPAGRKFEADCAELPYVLRFYFAWKRGLPFSYAEAMQAQSNDDTDLRYTRQGNRVIGRTAIPSGRITGMEAIRIIREATSTASYRTHPDHDNSDFYSPAIKPGSIRPGTMLYDPAGHVAVVFRVDADGRVHTFDAHTDFTLTQMDFDVRFARQRPAQGAGFKNWRPIQLKDADRGDDGILRGGRVVPAPNTAIDDFSTEQFYGVGPRPAENDWANGPFTFQGETVDFYDFVRARLAGQLRFDPVKEVRVMTEQLCADLSYRAAAVDLGRALANRPQPIRLPKNIYGADGDWEMFSTPSRDARLKTAFKYLRDTVERFVVMDRQGDRKHLEYAGSDLAADLLKTYTRTAGRCAVHYRKSDGQIKTLAFEDARQRLFAMSFDPYHCPERRWGASDPAELASCPDRDVKRAWYAAEQVLRNQINRSYDTKMSYALDDLMRLSGNAEPPPNTDVRGYLMQVGLKDRP